jgi:hypothetical protein
VTAIDRDVRLSWVVVVADEGGDVLHLLVGPGQRLLVEPA